jgi:hypothetical protein
LYLSPTAAKQGFEGAMALAESNPVSAEALKGAAGLGKLAWDVGKASPQIAMEALNLGARGAASAVSALERGASVLKAPFRAWKGESSAQALAKLRDSVTEGSLAADLTAGKTVATEARINLLRGTREISEEQARAALQTLESHARVDELRALGVYDAASVEAGTVLDTFHNAPPVEKIGESMLGRMNAWLRGTRGSRATIADAMYSDYHEAAAARQAAGDTFQQSESGSALISRWRGRLSTEGEVSASAAERALLQDILRDVEGVPGAEGQMSHSNPTVVREALRKLREAADGRPPSEGYAAIGQQRAGSLAKDLSSAIEGWEPKLAEADARYREMSKTLEPVKTALGARALKGERFDQERLAMDPSAVPGMFFKTPKTVNEAIALSGGDRAAVEQAAANYAFRELSAAKTPEAARAWVDKNNEWLSALPNAHQRVERQVRQLESAQGKIDAIIKGRAARASRIAEQKAEIEKPAVEVAKTTAALEKEAKASLQDLREKIAGLTKGTETEGVPDADLVGVVRSLVNSSEHNRHFPAATMERWNKELNEIDRIVDKDAKRRRLMRWGGGVVAATVGVREARHAAHSLGINVP